MKSAIMRFFRKRVTSSAIDFPLPRFPSLVQPVAKFTEQGGPAGEVVIPLRVTNERMQDGQAHSQEGDWARRSCRS